MSIEPNGREFVDSREPYEVRSVGPFERFPVMSHGWTVPNLEAKHSETGVVLILDHRFSIDLPTDVAAGVINFIADATAIALGWSCHPKSVDWEPPHGYWDAVGAPYRRLPWRRLTGLGTDGGLD